MAYLGSDAALFEVGEEMKLVDVLKDLRHLRLGGKTIVLHLSHDFEKEYQLAKKAQKMSVSERFTAIQEYVDLHDLEPMTTPLEMFETCIELDVILTRLYLAINRPHSLQ